MKSLCLTITFTLLFSFSHAHAASDSSAKAKAFLQVAGYGTAGGALLGLASMAFGGSSRSVAQGASLGLYAGILFGTYILYTHSYPSGGKIDDSSPYDDGSAEEPNSFGFLEKKTNLDSYNKKENLILVELPVFKWNF